MSVGFGISRLAPRGLIVEGVTEEEDGLAVTVRSEAPPAACPLCSALSRAFTADISGGRRICRARDGECS